MTVEWQPGRRLSFATVASLLIIVLKTSAQDHTNVVPFEIPKEAPLPPDEECPVPSTICTTPLCDEVDTFEEVASPSNAECLVPSDNSTPKRICNTPACVDTAGDILSFLDESVDPCDDFYQFTCGGWLDRQEGTVEEFATSTAKMEHAVKGALRMNLTGTEPDYVRQVVLLHDSCIDKEWNKTLNIELFKKDFESLGGWPVLEGKDWDGKDFNWIDILLRMRELGYGYDGRTRNGLMEMVVKPESIYDSVNKITLEKSLYDLDRSFLEDGFNSSETIADYAWSVERAISFGADDETAKADMRDVKELEIMLYKIPDFKNDSQKMEYSIKELQDLAPQVNWMKYFNGMLVDPVYENDTVILPEPEYIFQLVDLLNSTDKRVVANYVFDRADYYYTWLFLQDKTDNLCEYLVTSHLRAAYMPSIAKRRFPDLSRLSREMDEIREWTEIIKKEYVNMFDDSDWLDSNSKNKAKEEAASILPMIGYPKEFYNDSFFEEMHKNMDSLQL